MGYIHYYDKDLVNVKLTEENLARLKNKQIWIDLQEPNSTELDLLRRKLKIHPTTIEDIKAHNSRAKIEEFKKYLEIVIYDCSEEDGDFVPIEIDLIVGTNFIITTHSRIIKSIKEEKKNRKKLTRLFRGGPDIFLHYIMDNIISHYVPKIEDIEDEIDELEDTIATTSDKSILNRINEVKRKVIFMRRIMHPQKEKIALLTKKGRYKFIREKTEHYFRDLHDDTIRLSDAIDSSKEAVNGLYENYMSVISYNMNEIMKTLSIIATIMMPLTFVTGIFGMNFGIMPWLKDSHGFWYSSILMALMAIGMLMYFKKKKWM